MPISVTHDVRLTGSSVYQLQIVGAKLIVCHPLSFEVAKAAACEAGIREDHIVLFEQPGMMPLGCIHVEDLIAEGQCHQHCFKERKLRPGEAKTKIAFLSFSSGTTGKPKVSSTHPPCFAAHAGLEAVAIPHYAPMSNVIQVATFNRENGTGPSRFVPGQVALGARICMAALATVDTID